MQKINSKSLLIIFLLVLLFLSPDTLAYEEKSKLEQFKEEVTTEAKEEKANYSDDNYHNHYQEDNDQSFWEWLFKEVFFRPIFHPRQSIVGRGMIDVVAYPYLGPYHSIERSQSTWGYQSDSKQGLIIDASITRQYISDNSLNLQTGAWRIDSSLIYQRLALDLAQTRYYNSLDEELYFNQALLSYIFAQNNYWEFKSGIGIEEIAGVNGFKYQYAIDYQKENLAWDLSLGLTRLTTAKTVLEFSPGIGYFNQNSELRLGYRFKAINDNVLFGPELTARIKF